MGQLNETFGTAGLPHILIQSHASDSPGLQLYTQYGASGGSVDGNNNLSVMNAYTGTAFVVRNTGNVEFLSPNAKISGSATSTGSFGHVTVDGVLKTGDIELENERGHWRIIEESEYLSIHNVKHDKKYKFVLQEIE